MWCGYRSTDSAPNRGATWIPVAPLAQDKPGGTSQRKETTTSTCRPTSLAVDSLRPTLLSCILTGSGAFLVFHGLLHNLRPPCPSLRRRARGGHPDRHSASGQHRRRTTPTGLFAPFWLLLMAASSSAGAHDGHGGPLHIDRDGIPHWDGSPENADVWEERLILRFYSSENDA